MAEYGDKARMQYVVGVHVCVCVCDLGRGRGMPKDFCVTKISIT